MSAEKLYSINSEINTMIGGELFGGDTQMWVILTLLIVFVVLIILYLSGILSFHTPNFIGTRIDKSSEKK